MKVNHLNQERIDVSDEDVLNWVEARRPPPVEEPIIEEPLPEVSE